MSSETVQDRVKKILEHNPNARDCDLTLINLYWNFYEKSELIAIDNTISKLYRVHSLQHLNLKSANITAPTSIIRARAHIQNKLGLFKPSSAVVEERKDREEVMKDSYGVSA